MCSRLQQVWLLFSDQFLINHWKKSYLRLCCVHALTLSGRQLQRLRLRLCLKLNGCLLNILAPQAVWKSWTHLWRVDVLQFVLFTGLITELFIGYWVIKKSWSTLTGHWLMRGHHHIMQWCIQRHCYTVGPVRTSTCLNGAKRTGNHCT